MYDANYGEVNAYHRVVWLEVYGIDLDMSKSISAGELVTAREYSELLGVSIERLKYRLGQLSIKEIGKSGRALLYDKDVLDKEIRSLVLGKKVKEPVDSQPAFCLNSLIFSCISVGCKSPYDIAKKTGVSLADVVPAVESLLYRGKLYFSASGKLCIRH